MKKYTAPEIALLYIANEDILTESDPGEDDIVWDDLPSL